MGNQKIIPGIAGKVVSISPEGALTLLMLSGETLTTQFYDRLKGSDGKFKFIPLNVAEITKRQAISALNYYSGTMINKKAKEVFDEIIASTGNQITLPDLLTPSAQFQENLVKEETPKEEIDTLLKMRGDILRRIAVESMPHTKTISMSLIGTTIEIPLSTNDGGQSWTSVVSFSRSIVKNNGCGQLLPTHLIRYHAPTDAAYSNQQTLNTKVITPPEMSNFLQFILKSLTPYLAQKNGRQVMEPENTIEQAVRKLSFLPYIKTAIGHPFEKKFERIYSVTGKSREALYDEAVVTFKEFKEFAQKNPQRNCELLVIINQFADAVIHSEAHELSRAGLFPKQVFNLSKTALTETELAAVSNPPEYYGYYVLPPKGTGFFNGSKDLFNYLPKNHTLSLLTSKKGLSLA